MLCTYCAQSWVYKNEDCLYLLLLHDSSLMSSSLGASSSAQDVNNKKIYILHDESSEWPIIQWGLMELPQWKARVQTMLRIRCLVDWFLLLRRYSLNAQCFKYSLLPSSRGAVFITLEKCEKQQSKMRLKRKASKWIIVWESNQNRQIIR